MTPGVQVAGDDAAGAAVLHDEVEHLGAVVDGDGAGADLLGQRLVGAEQQLLAGLAPGVERARHLGAAERAVVEQAAVLAGERHALGDALVDDVDRHLREPVHVRLTGAEVAALHRVVEEPVDRVAVALVVLGRVDAALGGDRVGPARRVVERERVDVVAELAERGGRRASGEAGADDDDLEAAAVVRRDQLHVELVLIPPLLDGPGRAPCRRGARLARSSLMPAPPGTDRRPWWRRVPPRTRAGARTGCSRGPSPARARGS